MDTRKLTADELVRVGLGLITLGYRDRNEVLTPEARAVHLKWMREDTAPDGVGLLEQTLQRVYVNGPGHLMNKHYPAQSDTDTMRDRLLRMADGVIGKDI